jgi:hypothetical protein
MSTFYWVGGSGNWDDSDTTNWASSSGGAGGAGVPTLTDDVVFDANSSGGGAFAVTVTGTDIAPAVCQDFTASSLSHVMTMTMGATAVLECYGSMSLPASNLTWSGTIGALLRFKSTSSGKTITTNGVTLTATNLLFDGVGGAWSLASALTTSTNNTITLNNGTFDTDSTSNYSLTTGAIIVSTGVKTLNLNASSVTVAGSSSMAINDTTNLTFNAGTSTITCSAASPTFNGGSQTFYNVTFSSTVSGTTTLNGSNTYNDLIFTTPTAIRFVILGGNQTSNGALTFGTGNTNIRKFQISSNVVGTQRTITANGTLSSLNDVSFRDIAAAGTVSTPWTGTRIGSGGNLSNITADAPKTVYRIGTGNWNANRWSLSSGGSVDLDNFPLPQDAIIFDNNTTSGTHTINSSYWCGSLDCSAVTSAITIASGTIIPEWHGDMTLDSDITITATGNAWAFAKPSGSGAQVITPAGVTFAPGLTFASPASVQFAANITTDRTATLASGTLDLNDFDLTCLTFNSSNSNTRSIDFGSTGQITVTGNNATIWSSQTLTNFSFTGTSNVVSNYSGSTGTRIMIHGATATGTEANSLNFSISAGTDTVTLNATFFGRNVNFTGFSGTLTNTARNIYGNLTLSAGMTINNGNAVTTFAATSGTQQVTTNGKTLDFPITVNAPGATVQLQDALTIGSTKTLRLTAGTLDSNDFDVTAGAFSSNTTNTRALDLGSSDWTLSGSDTVWDATDGTGLTVTPGTSSITLTSASAYTFAGGGKTYYDLNLNGDADVTLLGSNTFNQLSVAENNLTITFEAGTNTTVAGFSADGTSGNLILMRSSTPGTVWEMTDTSGSVSVSYGDIQDMNAKGGATFQCNDGINSGNNTGVRFVDSAFNIDNFLGIF